MTHQQFITANRTNLVHSCAVYIAIFIFLNFPASTLALFQYQFTPNLTAVNVKLICILQSYKLANKSAPPIQNFILLLKNIYEDIVFTRFFGSLPAVTLTFDPWSQKLISTRMNANISVSKIGWNSFHWVVRYGVYKVLGHCLLWPN